MTTTGDVRTERGGAGGAPPTLDDAAVREFQRLMDRRDVSAVFQPIVNLHTGEIVGLEALARGPESSQFSSPLALFAAARTAGRVAELDWVCRAAAFRAFYRGGVSPSMSLFVNIEPEALAEDCPADLVPLVAQAESDLRVFVEVNDRALASDPAAVLATVDRARAKGWGIAVDDVGASRASVSLLPVVSPDLVKLDRRILNDANPGDVSALVTGVLRHVEKTGASLLVEGVEDQADVDWALALGATYGQGFYLGAPGPLRGAYPVPRAPVRLLDLLPTGLQFDSPFRMFDDCAHQRVDRDLLGQLVRILAHAPRSAGSQPVVLACMGRGSRFSGHAVEHLLGLANGALLFVLFGMGPPGEPVPGVRRVRLRRDDPMAEECFAIVLSDQAPVALFARASPDGLFDVAMTQSAELVHAIVHHLIRRVPGPAQGDRALPGVRAGIGSHDEQPLDDEEPVHDTDPRAVDDLAGAASAPKRGGWRGRLARHS